MTNEPDVNPSIRPETGQLMNSANFHDRWDMDRHKYIKINRHNAIRTVKFAIFSLTVLEQALSEMDDVEDGKFQIHDSLNETLINITENLKTLQNA